MRKRTSSGRTSQRPKILFARPSCAIVRSRRFIANSASNNAFSYRNRSHRAFLARTLRDMVHELTIKPRHTRTRDCPQPCCQPPGDGPPFTLCHAARKIHVLGMWLTTTSVLPRPRKIWLSSQKISRRIYPFFAAYLQKDSEHEKWDVNGKLWHGSFCIIS